MLQFDNFLKNFFLLFFREEVDADSVNLMAMGACGAFIHGLEDEFLAVRSATIDALTFLSTKNAKLANLALDFLVDMFNDEIESVRLKAIEALTIIADHICLQVKRFISGNFCSSSLCSPRVKHEIESHF